MSNSRIEFHAQSKQSNSNSKRRNRCIVVYFSDINGHWTRQRNGKLYTCRNLRRPPRLNHREHQLKCLQSEEEGILLRERHFSTNPRVFLPRIIRTFRSNLAPIQFGSNCKPLGKENARRAIETSPKTSHNQASSIDRSRRAGYVSKFLLFMAIYCRVSLNRVLFG